MAGDHLFWGLWGVLQALRHSSPAPQALSQLNRAFHTTRAFGSNGFGELRPSARLSAPPPLECRWSSWQATISSGGSGAFCKPAAAVRPPTPRTTFSFSLFPAAFLFFSSCIPNCSSSLFGPAFLVSFPKQNHESPSRNEMFESGGAGASCQPAAAVSPQNPQPPEVLLSLKL